MAFWRDGYFLFLKRSLLGGRANYIKLSEVWGGGRTHFEQNYDFINQFSEVDHEARGAVRIAKVYEKST